MAALTAEKSILLHGYKYAEKSNCRKTPKIEIWFLIKLTAEGCHHVKEIYKDLLTDELDDIYILQTSCALVGSFLYVLGGRGGIWFEASSSVRCLDTQNPADGWKSCGDLPLIRPRATVGVAGNLIYLLPRVFGSSHPSGCVYDTEKETGDIINPPTPCLHCESSEASRARDWDPAFCAAFDLNDEPGGRGVLAPSTLEEHLYLYNPDQKSWKECCHFEILKPESRKPPKYSVLNGILYLSYYVWDDDEGPATLLYAYDIHNRECILQIKLPIFKYMVPEWDSQLFLVAVADFELCYLWCRTIISSGPPRNAIHLVKVVISRDTWETHLSDEVHEVVATEILHCIQFDSHLYQDDEKAEGRAKSGRGTQHDSHLYENREGKVQGEVNYNDVGVPEFCCGAELKQIEVDENLRRCDDNLMDENLRLCEENSCLRKELQQLRARINYSENQNSQKRISPLGSAMTVVFAVCVGMFLFFFTRGS